MSEGTSLSDLIERLEKATEGSREIDALIECEIRRFQACAVGLNDEQRSHWKPVGSKGEVIDDQGFTRYHAPLYSQSMDAAISMIPRPMCWSGGESNEDDQPWSCITDGEGRDYAATGATPIIALCIAALKARLATEVEG